MSAAAIPICNVLVGRGMDDAPPTCGEFREEFANVRAENRAEFANVRAETAELRREMQAGFAELRKEIRTLYRLIIALLILVGGSAITVAAAAVKIMAGL